MSSRGQPIYDWWSRHQSLFNFLYVIAFLGRESKFRDRAVESLSLDAGEQVLELGCGPGNSFEALRTRVGDGGRVIGIDYSIGMTERAQAHSLSLKDSAGPAGATVSRVSRKSWIDGSIFSGKNSGI
jgi:ubiquinone/menaquinone biosynthesis C-methylase UbiE